MITKEIIKEKKKHTHIGVYGLLIKDNKTLLIKKVTGPYDGLLDLPGGSFEFGEKPENVLKRELKEEVGITPTNIELFDVNSVLVDWKYKDNDITTHHIGTFYKVIEYEGRIKENVEIDEHNDDSLGASFYNIKDLKKEDLSLISIIELEKLGYKIN